MADTTKTKKLCQGCRNNFYNGNNPLAVAVCWHFKTAKLVTRTQVGTWQNPPYVWRPRQTLSCHNPVGTTWIKRDDPRIVEPVT